MSPQPSMALPEMSHHEAWALSAFWGEGMKVRIKSLVRTQTGSMKLIRLDNFRIVRLPYGLESSVIGLFRALPKKVVDKPV